MIYVCFDESYINRVTKFMERYGFMKRRLEIFNIRTGTIDGLIALPDYKFEI